MFRVLPLVIAQLPTRPILRVFMRASLLTLLLFGGLWWALDTALEHIDAAGWPGWLQRLWIAGDGWLALPVVLVALFFLFPAVATAVMGLFLDGIVDAVEARHYPHARATRHLGLAENIALGLASGIRVLAWNLALLPIYVALLLTAIGPFLLFLMVNAWLLGRDFLEMVAARHLPPPARRRWLSEHRPLRIGVGFTVALLFLVPIFNLFAPIVGAMLGAHAFHLDRPEGSDATP